MSLTKGTVYFERHSEIRELKPVNYVYNHYRPIIKVTRGRDQGRLFREEFACPLYPRSFVSVSLLSNIIYKRFCHALPLYRLEQDYKSRKVPISRQTMSNWLIRFAYEVFSVVLGRMREELDQNATVRQCDETTWKVIVWPEDTGKKNASRGYIWVHTTGELSEGHQVVLYVFERSRCAEHLREYLRNLAMVLVSDAYGAYFAIEKESGGKITVSCCWMHLRRMWAKAYVAMKQELDGLTDHEFLEHAVVKGFLLSNKIFKADTPLKKLTAVERLERRDKEVRPHVDDFFDYVHSFDTNQTITEGKLGEALTYARNQEEHLREFLNNGNIPIDNYWNFRYMSHIVNSHKDRIVHYRTALLPTAIRRYGIDKSPQGAFKAARTITQVPQTQAPTRAFVDARDSHGFECIV